MRLYFYCTDKAGVNSSGLEAGDCMVGYITCSLDEDDEVGL